MLIVQAKNAGIYAMLGLLDKLDQEQSDQDALQSRSQVASMGALNATNSMIPDCLQGKAESKTQSQAESDTGKPMSIDPDSGAISSEVVSVKTEFKTSSDLSSSPDTLTLAHTENRAAVSETGVSASTNSAPSQVLQKYCEGILRV